jgi:hypothetical protein
MQISTQQEDIISNTELCFDIEVHGTEEDMGQRTTLQQIIVTV